MKYARCLKSFFISEKLIIGGMNNRLMMIPFRDLNPDQVREYIGKHQWLKGVDISRETGMPYVPSREEAAAEWAAFYSEGLFDYKICSACRFIYRTRLDDDRGIFVEEYVEPLGDYYHDALLGIKARKGHGINVLQCQKCRGYYYKRDVTELLTNAETSVAALEPIAAD
jgi:hypothetical protein